MLRLLPLLLVGLLALPSTSCTKAPPNLSPAGQAAFQKTRVIKALDLLRDFAIDAEAAQPQVLSTDVTRKVVTYHQSALKILDAAGTGWKALVATSLTEFGNSLPAAERGKLKPYLDLVAAVIAEVV